MVKKIFVSYVDENGLIASGKFEKIGETKDYLRIKSKSNTITINWKNIIKVKEGNQK